jgi:hypothetical protein
VEQQAAHDWSADPRYIIDLLRRIVTVSLETMKIVDALPALDIIEQPLSTAQGESRSLGAGRCESAE